MDSIEIIDVLESPTVTKSNGEIIEVYVIYITSYL
jgi:hypothetical protein